MTPPSIPFTGSYRKLILGGDPPLFYAREVTGSYGKIREAVGSNGKQREATGSYGKLWEVTGSCGKLREAAGSCGKLAAVNTALKRKGFVDAAAT